MVHVEQRVRCADCEKCYCKHCEDRCPACYGIHISTYTPSQAYAEAHPAKPINPGGIRWQDGTPAHNPLIK